MVGTIVGGGKVTVGSRVALAVIVGGWAGVGVQVASSVAVGGWKNNGGAATLHEVSENAITKISGRKTKRLLRLIIGFINQIIHGAAGKSARVYHGEIF